MIQALRIGRRLLPRFILNPQLQLVCYIKKSHQEHETDPCEKSDNDQRVHDLSRSKNTISE
jgi:hypothetical protein